MTVYLETKNVRQDCYYPKTLLFTCKVLIPSNQTLTVQEHETKQLSPLQP